jgi:hypothetical protein
VPRTWVRILLIVLAVAVVLYLVGYLIFNAGGSTPGSGTGETITGLSTERPPP